MEPGFSEAHPNAEMDWAAARHRDRQGAGSVALGPEAQRMRVKCADCGGPLVVIASKLHEESGALGLLIAPHDCQPVIDLHPLVIDDKVVYVAKEHLL